MKDNIIKLIRFTFYVLLALFLFSLVCAAFGEVIHTIQALYASSDNFMKLIMFLIALFFFRKTSPVALRILGVRP